MRTCFHSQTSYLIATTCLSTLTVFSHHGIIFFFFNFYLQNLPSCSINLQSFHSLPKICSTWSLWCKEEEDGEHSTADNCTTSCDQSTTQSSINLVRTPPKLPKRHRRKRLRMPFRRRNWCGCIQVSFFSAYFVSSIDPVTRFKII